MCRGSGSDSWPGPGPGPGCQCGFRVGFGVKVGVEARDGVKGWGSGQDLLRVAHTCAFQAEVAREGFLVLGWIRHDVELGLSLDQ